MPILYDIFVHKMYIHLRRVKLIDVVLLNLLINNVTWLNKAKKVFHTSINQFT